MRRLLIPLLVLTAASSLHAEFGVIRNQPPPRTLLAQNTAERRVIKAKEPRPAGSFGLSIWVSTLRIPYGEPEPVDAFNVGAGTEAAWFFHRHLAVSLGIGAWSYRLRYDAPTFNQKYRYVHSVETEPAFRFYPLHWEHGSLYIDTRFVYMYADGNPPARTSHSVGGGAYFGVEVGSPRVRFFAESGLGYRRAITRSNAGWLDFDESSDAGAVIWDYIRLGIRIYV